MFRENIQKMVDRLDGRGGAGILMGFDGITVESYSRAGAADLQTVTMELAHLLAQMRAAVTALELGPVHELVIRADKLTILVQVLTKEYFLAFGVDPEGNVGKARYLMRLLAPQVRAEL